MEWFSLGLNSLTIISQSILHIAFSGHIFDKKTKVWYFVIYLFLLCIIEKICIQFSFSEIPAIGLEIIVLYGINRFMFRNRHFVSLVAAILAIYIFQLSFGMINSVEAMIFSSLIGKPQLYPLLLSATLIAITICIFCYILILKVLSLKEDKSYSKQLLFPTLFFFSLELYILQTSYHHLFYVFSLEEFIKHIILLFLQGLGLGTLIYILHSFQIQGFFTSLMQIVQLQKTYIVEAKMRYEQTRSFRHDIKNHLCILNGLLNVKKVEEAKRYLKKLKITSTSLSFSYQTGNPVIDILLDEKLTFAKMNGIVTEVSLLSPNICRIDNFDLCVIFSNALDNAVNACRFVEGKKSIHIFGEQQGDFYRLEFKNTCCSKSPLLMGIGLSNIKSVAKKYHGTILIDNTNQYFCLNVLLNISLPSDSSSNQNS
mgnify:CR=1 FL=1